MNEQAETKSTPKPEWLELPEEEKQRHTYWTTQGNDIQESIPEPAKLTWLQKLRGIKPESAVSKGPIKVWSCVYHSKEEAEASASIPKPYWKWDGREAAPVTLQESMFLARRQGRLGVAILGWKNGEWITLKQYPTHEPLLGD